jgi:NAD(P)-dependent dehydrogenase (short-subunit alcohol dehydrogenase family)
VAARTALVTGVSGGLGSHLAGHLIDGGWRVTGVGRTAAGKAPGRPSLTYVEADLATEEGVAEIAGQFTTTPDLVVHAATVYPREPDTLPLAELDAVFRVNALAPYRLSKLLLDLPREDRPVTVVCVNSEAMFHADETSGMYAASKAALRVLTASLAASCRGQDAAAVSLVLGPLATPSRRAEIDRLAQRHGRDPVELTRYLLRKSNPDLVIADFIGLDVCCRAIEHVAGLGPVANGMVYRLDGGSAGTLI